MSFRLRFDWIDAGPSPDVIARSTMATLSIEADGATITSVLDRANRIYSDVVVVPLFSVAEWLVTNWWHLWYEVEDTNEQRPEFEHRHNLAFASDGFVLPSLTMTPAERRVTLHWDRYRPRHARIEFVDEGRASFAREDLESAFGAVIEAVLERLRGNAETRVAGDSLGVSWNAINALDPAEREFSRAAALLGIDPFDVRDDVSDAIVAFWDHAEPAIREDVLASVGSESLARVGEWLDGALRTLAEGANDAGNDWRGVRGELPALPDSEPWTRGYALARAVRGQLGAGGDRYDFVARGPLAIAHYETQPPSSRIQGLVAAETPTCMTARKGKSGTRFLIARALGDYLGRSVPGPGMLSSLATDRQAQSRAFAAEFLVPAESLRGRLGGDSADAERTDEISREFGVSSELVRRQIQNHELARVAAY